ncbi:hypothetical protein [Robiginitalea sp.]|uniref:hypothetical protein n=1 Tax=Robiginitalea sp. TaxID=1902411 RepID=UPI003C7829EC
MDVISAFPTVQQSVRADRFLTHSSAFSGLMNTLGRFSVHLGGARPEAHVAGNPE